MSRHISTSRIAVSIITYSQISVSIESIRCSMFAFVSGPCADVTLYTTTVKPHDQDLCGNYWKRLQESCRFLEINEIVFEQALKYIRMFYSFTTIVHHSLFASDLSTPENGASFVFKFVANFPMKCGNKIRFFQHFIEKYSISMMDKYINHAPNNCAMLNSIQTFQMFQCMRFFFQFDFNMIAYS